MNDPQEGFETAVAAYNELLKVNADLGAERDKYFKAHDQLVGDLVLIAAELGVPNDKVSFVEVMNRVRELRLMEKKLSTP